MTGRTIGTCGCCGGRVVVPEFWLGMDQPEPVCASCGAHPKRHHGNVIEMESPRREHGSKVA